MSCIVSEPDVDEFAGYDFSEFTEQDFVQIDAEIDRKQHLPKVTIAYDLEPPKLSHLAYSNLQRRSRGIQSSPLQRYRNHGILSVTDLVSPTWCEVQFDYGLRGKRSRPVNDRPTTFRSASGKEIKVNKDVAVKNEVTTTKGKEVHKSLEREVKGPEVMVDITMPEERWALRLVNMMVCLRGMQAQGFTREMPVFGVEDNEIIVGIIDEIHYQPVEKPSQSPVTSSQTSPETFFSPSQKTQDDTTNRYKLQLVDTKTRRTFSIPPPEDMLSSRLQLMMYHRLLSRLVSINHPFDFAHFWQISDVDPERRLSTKFIIQAGLLADNEEFQILSLGDLSIYWNDLVHQLHIIGVGDELQLIYRLQPNTKLGTPAVICSEEEALSMAIEASLAESCKDNTAVASGSKPVRDLDKEFESKPRSAVKNSKDQFTLVGTKTFNYDADLLSAHLTDALGYWRGLRKPKGVPVQLARRCHTCEYFDDCEWREERAKDFREQALLKREGSGPDTPNSM